MLTRFDAFLDLVILAYFNVIFIEFYTKNALSAFFCVILHFYN